MGSLRSRLPCSVSLQQMAACLPTSRAPALHLRVAFFSIIVFTNSLSQESNINAPGSRTENWTKLLVSLVFDTVVWESRSARFYSRH